MKRFFVLIILVILAGQLFLLLNLKFTAWPEMTLWPYLINNGWLPYRDIAIAHTPHLLISLSYYFKIFGIGIAQLKIYTWSLIIFTDLILFFVANKIWGRKVALISLLAYPLWQIFFEGNGLWFDLILAPLALITFYFSYNKRYFWTGLFWAFMIFNKQTAVWFLIPISLSIFLNKERIIPNIKNLILGSLATTIIWGVGLWTWGVMPSFINWAINFGIFILPKSSGQIQLPDIKTLAISVFPFSIFIPLVWKTKGRYQSLLFWSIAGALGAYPRFEYFHFQPALPFIAIAIGLMFSDIKNSRVLPRLFLVGYCLMSLFLFGKFIMRNYHQEVRFNEASVQEITKYVINNTEPNDKIFVLNWWDSVYALADREPGAKPWVPQLSWYMELPGIQEKIVEDLKSSKPKLIILNPYTESGLSAHIPQKLFDYVTSNYKIKDSVNGVDMLISK